jgi:formamidopyrimidine-DNA glycosylase
MGPEPLTLRASDLSPRLSNTRRAIKTALLDQRIIAGIGNIYADESLFESRIHPTTPANRLKPDQIKNLSRAIKLILRRAIKHKGSSLRDYVDADGESGAFQRLHRVYDRKGHPCPRCQTPIKRIVLGGRSTHFCPTCQPKPHMRKHKPRRGERI